MGSLQTGGEASYVAFMKGLLLMCLITGAYSQTPFGGVADLSVRVRSPWSPEQRILEQGSVKADVLKCPTNWLHCDGRCISPADFCDDALECSDGSDESGCEIHGVVGKMRAIHFKDRIDANPMLLVLKVPNHIPPPKDTYTPFFEFPVTYIEKFPRLSTATNARYHVDVYYLSAPISNAALKKIGFTHNGIGFVVHKKNSSGAFQESFRMDVQYWAAMFNATQGPVRNEQGQLDLVDNRMQWRNRALMSTVKSFGKWDKYWTQSYLLGSTDADGFNKAMEYTEQYANTRRYFANYHLVKDGITMQPASNCEEFMVTLCDDVFGWNVTQYVPTYRAYVHLKSYKMVSLLHDSEAIMEPYQDKLLGYGTVFQENHAMTRHFSQRQDYRFQRELAWSLPLWVGEDGKPFEASDFPENYGLMIIDRIELVHTGAKKWSMDVHTPYAKVPRVNARETLQKIKDQISVGLAHLLESDVVMKSMASSDELASIPASKAFSGVLLTMGNKSNASDFLSSTLQELGSKFQKLEELEMAVHSTNNKGEAIKLSMELEESGKEALQFMNDLFEAFENGGAMQGAMQASDL